jgi:anaerobic C4-dicarboxylate transporter
MARMAGTPSQSDLAHSITDIAEHLGMPDHQQPPALFALVDTAALIAAEPSLSSELADGSVLTSIDQEIQVPEQGLEEMLATTTWPPTVLGCVLVQSIVVLPPKAEEDLDSVFEQLLSDPLAAEEAARAAATSHPEHQRARLHVGVLRGGISIALLELITENGREFRMHPSLAPNLIEALFRTFD